MRATIEALNAAATLFGARLDADQLRTYCEVLATSGAADERLAAGVKAACGHCRWMPRPADILASLPQHPVRVPDADDAELSPEEIAFNRAAFPLLGRYMRREIGKDEYIGLMRQAARRTGVEHKIPWDDFYAEGVPT